MPNPSELERQRLEQAYEDAQDTHLVPTLEERAKAMGFDDLAAAMKYLETLEENPPVGSARNPIRD